MLAVLSLSFTTKTEASTVLAPGQQEQIAQVLEEDAQVMSNSQLDTLLDGQPDDVRAEVLRINTEARDVSLRIALLVPVLAGLIGLVISFRMRRLPDIAPAAPLEGTTLG